MGGTSLFLNSEHFLETNKSYQGCIRNLEINNKAYNLNPTDFGGDILSGVDIGKCLTHYGIRTTKIFVDSLFSEIFAFIFLRRGFILKSHNLSLIFSKSFEQALLLIKQNDKAK